jgi:hypothetical protein
MMLGTKSVLTTLALFAVIASQDAKATFVTLEPDNFAVGTNVSSVSSLVSLSTFHKSIGTANSPVFSSVYVSDCATPNGCAGTTGTRVFSDAFGGLDKWGGLGGSIYDAVQCFGALGRNATSSYCEASASSHQFNVMVMTFADLTDSVELSGAFNQQDSTDLFGFDDSFNLVGVSSRSFDFSGCGSGAASPLAYCRTTVSLTSALTDIRYVLAGGWSNGSALDNLRFEAPDATHVSEPGALALFAGGLACMALSRRRARVSAR